MRDVYDHRFPDQSDSALNRTGDPGLFYGLDCRTKMKLGGLSWLSNLTIYVKTVLFCFIVRVRPKENSLVDCPVNPEQESWQKSDQVEK